MNRNVRRRYASTGWLAVMYALTVLALIPLGLILAPNGDLIVANGDAVNPVAAQPSELVEFTPEGNEFLEKFIAEGRDDQQKAIGIVGGKSYIARHAHAREQSSLLAIL